MDKRDINDRLEKLPGCVAEYVRRVLKKMRYRKKVRLDVMSELKSHFEDALRDCKNEAEKEQKAKQIIEQFGDAKLLAILLRRGKKRCRPLWKKVLIRAGQVVGIIFLYLFLCTSPMLFGKPTIKVDYVERLNETAQAGMDDSENARTYYLQADQVYNDMPKWLSNTTVKWPSDFNDVELKSLIEWLSSNQEAFALLRKAAECPAYWNEYERSGEPSLDLTPAIMPGAMAVTRNYRQVAFGIRENILYEAYSGDIEQALQDCFVLIKLGNYIHSKGFLVEQLVGIALEAVGIGESFRILEKVDVPPDVLENAQKRLESLFSENTAVISLETEKILYYDLIQKGFTDDGNGDGRVLTKGFPYFINSPKVFLRILLFDYPSRKEVLEMIDDYYARSSEHLSKTPWQLHQEGIDSENWAEGIETSLMLDILSPAFNQVGKNAWRLEAERRALLTLLAILRYEKEQGQYPDDLNQLVRDDYLSELPNDPFSDGTLDYEKENSDFILYSLGLRDELSRDGENNEAERSDWVFWPVQ